MTNKINDQQNNPNYSIVARFLEQVELFPEQIALVFEHERLTYDELNRKSNQLAHHLIAKGVQPESCVGILTERSTEFIIGILAILKAGAAYVPIDLEYPEERIRNMMDDCSMNTLLIHNKALHFQADQVQQIDLLNLNYSNLSETDPAIPTTGHSLCYVMFTSGSTGKPKGVLIEHQGVYRLVIDTNYINITPQDRILQTGTLTFDASTFDIWGALLNGAKLYLAHNDKLTSIRHLKRLFSDHQITLIWMASSLMNQLIEMDVTVFEHVGSIVTGGDRISKRHVQKLMETFPDLAFIHAYGPTENTTYSTCVRLLQIDENEVSIGYPITGTEIHILKEDGSEAEPGEQGEICTSGLGLARGYLNDPELTRQKFVTHPQRPELRIYRTGDLGYVDKNGLLYFLDRIDQQVKIRGFRVEPGEIESRMMEIEGIKHAIVMPFNDPAGYRFLCAYLVSQKQHQEQDIKEALSAVLPDYMVPSYFIFLDTIPINSNGKIDRKALPHPTESKEEKPTETRPDDADLEGALLSLFQRVLKRSDFSVQDNFFHLGGHSLLAAQVIYTLQEKHKLDISLSDFFLFPSIEGLLKHLAPADESQTSPIPALKQAASYPVSHAQRRIWVLSQLEEGSKAYHVPLMVRIDGHFDHAAFEKAFAYLVNRHESLRTTFAQEDGKPVQIIHPYQQQKHSPTIRSHHGSISDELIAGEKQRQHQERFDLTEGPLFKAHLYLCANDSALFSLNLHHIICDGWSLKVLTNDLITAYQAFLQKGEPKQAPLRIQYKDISAWQNSNREGEAGEQSRKFWLDLYHLAEHPLDTLDFPIDFPRPLLQQFDGKIYSTQIKAEDLILAKNLMKETESSGFMLMLATLNALLHHYTDQEDFIIGFPIAGRSHADMRDQIGLYMNTLALRVRFDADQSFEQLLKQVRKIALGAFEHQEYPFDELLEELKPERDLSRSPLFDICLMYQNLDLAETEATPSNNLHFRQVESIHDVSKFDLTMVFIENGDALDFNIEYNTSLFKADSIEKLAERFKKTLQLVSQQAHLPVAQLELLDEQEKQQLFGDWNQTKLIVPETHSILDEWQLQWQKKPSATAICSDDKTYSRNELEERSNVVANLLIQSGIHQEQIVAVFLEPSIDLLPVLYGILKAGGCYLPVDPGFPADRIQYLLSDSHATMMISQKGLIDRILAPEKVLLLDEIDFSDQNNQARPIVKIKPEQAAYMIYTSGSSGQPKGVVIEHRQVVNFFYGMDERIPFEAGKSRLLNVTTISFDISVLELFWTSTRGIEIHLTGTALKAGLAQSKQISGKPIDFGLFYFASGEDDQNKYELLFEGARFADANGFSAIWTPERHFHEFGGIFPNPAVTGAAVAAITKHVHIRSGSVVLPLHNTIRVAEEWSVVDNISNGRVGVSIASGWVLNDFHAFAPGKHSDRQQIMFNEIDRLKKLWRGEAFDLTGEDNEHSKVRIYPKPIQAELPMWVTAGGSPETFRMAGAAGHNLLSHLLGQTVEELADKIAIYRKARREAGHTGEGTVSLMLHTFIGEQLDEVIELCRKPFCDYLRSAAGLVRSYGKAMGKDVDDQHFSEADMEALLNHAYERYYDTAALIGTQTSCLPLLEKLSQAGVNELACLIDFGVPSKRVKEHLPYIQQLKTEYHRLLEKQKEQNSLSETIDTRGITHLQATPSLLKLLLAEAGESKQLAGLKTLMLGGEALPPELVGQIKHKTEAHIYNMYGPTECTIWSSVAQIDSEVITIGTPIANTEFYVLNRRGKAVIPGVKGELYISGKGLARGYFERAELDKERFPVHGLKKQERWYRTGDLVKHLTDGSLVYLGRNDEQVKIRGHRIETGEIENALKQISGIHDAAVIALGQGNEKELCAYLICTEKIDINDLQIQIGKQLPDYMLPQRFVQLEQFPMTPNGKTDRRKLAAVSGQELRHAGVYEAPQNEEEKILVQIWEELLKRKNDNSKISVTDHFFRIGGDSIKAIQVSGRAGLKGYRLEVRDIFAHPTIRELAPYMKPGHTTISQETRSGNYEMSPIQSWFFENYPDGENHFNHSVILRLKERADLGALQTTIDALKTHHDHLRSRFEQDATGKWQAIIDQPKSEAITIVDLRQSGAPLQELKVHASGVQASHQLNRGELMQVVLYQLPDGDRLLFCLHHLLVDGISWRILFEDFGMAYLQAIADSAINLPPKTEAFGEWTKQLKQLAQSKHFKREAAFWEDMLNQSAANIQPDFENQPGKVKDKTVVRLQLSEQDTEALRGKANEAYHTEINDLLLSAWQQALHQWRGLNSSLLLLEGHGREDLGTHQDFSRTVGWFTAMYPVLLSTEPSDWGRSILKQKERLRRIPKKGIGYGMLRYMSQEALKLKKEAEVIFNYLGEFGEGGGQTEMPFEFSGENIGSANNPDLDMDQLFELSGMIISGRLEFSIAYSQKQFKAESMEQLAEHFKTSLEQLIAHCLSQKTSKHSLSDFRYPGMELLDIGLDDLPEKAKIWLNHGEQIESIYPLSPLQEGMLYHYRIYPDTTANVHQLSYHIDGQLDAEKFRESWNDLLRRHDILRTRFLYHKLPNPVQVVMKEAEIEFQEIDLSNCNETEQQKQLVILRERDKQRGFVIDNDAMMRISLIKLAKERFMILWSYHHIILDGWCMGILTKELGQFYVSRLNGNINSGQKAPGYGEYLRFLQQQSVEALSDFWSTYLQGYEPVSNWMGQKNGIEAYTYSQIKKSVPHQLQGVLEEISKQTGVTLNTVVQSIWGLMIGELSGKADVVFGQTVSGRSPEINQVEEIIGIFINTVPVRIRYEANENFEQLISRIQNESVQLQAYHHSPLAEIQRISGAGNQLIDHILVFDNFPVQEKIQEESKSSFQIAGVETFEHTTYNLAVTFLPGKELAIRIEYNSLVIEKQLIEKLFERYFHLIEAVSKAGNQPLSSFLNTTERANTKSLKVAEQRTVLAESVQEEPQGETEIQLAQLWKEVLELKEVQRNDHFFNLGGHSLKAMSLVAHIERHFEIEFAVSDVFKYPTLCNQASHIETAVKNEYKQIQVAPVQEHYPLSNAQRRLFLQASFDPDQTTYNIPIILQLQGEVDEQRLENSFIQLVQRHESLRTRFILDKTGARQIITKGEQFKLEKLNSKLSPEALIKQFVRPFDLKKDFLFRAGIARLNDQHTLLLLDLHHIISDGGSVDILTTDFMAIYKGSTLAPLRLQYKDFAVWEEAFMQSEEANKQKNYWVNVLQPPLPVLELAIDKPRPAIQDFNGEHVEHALDQELSQQIKHLATEYQLTPYMIFMAAYALLLHKNSGQEEVLIGTPVSGRSHADLLNVTGMFANTLVMRIKPDLQQGTRSFLETVKDHAIEAFENQDYPMDLLIESLKLKRDLSRPPLFSALFVMQNHQQQELKDDTSIEENTVKPYPFKNKISKFELSLNLVEYRNHFVLNFEYATSLFHEKTIKRFLNDFIEILISITTDQEKGLNNTIDLNNMFGQNNEERTISGSSNNESIASLFKKHLLDNPDQLVFDIDGQILSYSELHLKSNRLAHQLLEQGLEAENNVGIVTQKSPEFLIGLLAITKAGASPTLLDLKTPKDRLLTLLEEGAVQWLLIQESELNFLPPHIWQIDLLDEYNYSENEEDLSAYHPESGIATLSPFLIHSSSEATSTFTLQDQLFSANGNESKSTDDQSATVQGGNKSNASTQEEMLQQIWQEVLGIESIGLDENFFELGGHSLKALQIAVAIEEQLGFQLNIRELFTAPTIYELNVYLNSLGQTSAQEDIPKLVEQDDYEVSYAQQRLWMSAQLGEQDAAFNIPFTLKINGELNLSHLESAINLVTARHEAMRTYFISQEGIPRQVILKTLHTKLQVTPIPASENEAEKWINNKAAEVAAHRFDLSEAPLWKIEVLQETPDTHYLLINFHHIISDGWSVKLFSDEMLHFYSQLQAGNEVVPELLQIQYRDFAAWHNQLIAKNGALANYWHSQLAGELPRIDLPEAEKRPAIKSFKGNHWHFQFDEKTSTQIKALAVQFKVSDFVIIRSLLAIWIYCKTSQTDQIIGTPVAGRRHRQLQNVFGYFINMLPLRDQLDWSETVSSLINKINENTINALSNEDYPLDLMLQDIAYQREASRSPLFDLGISWQNFDETVKDESLASIQISSMKTEFLFAKYDLWLFGQENQGIYSFFFEYSTELFKPETMKIYVDEFIELAAALPDKLDSRLVELRSLNESPATNESDATDSDFSFNF